MTDRQLVAEYLKNRKPTVLPEGLAWGFRPRVPVSNRRDLY